MTQYTDPRLLAPPIEEEVNPYRPVWRRLLTQIGVFSSISVIGTLLIELLNVQFDTNVNFYLSLLYVGLPVLLWLLFSRIPENFVLEPRKNLIFVAIVSGLLASSFGIPLVRDFYSIDRWLPLEAAVQRIIGFTVTVGVVDTTLKFLTIRFMVFPHYFRIRTDAIAYCVASSIGYSFAINLYYVVTVQPTLSMAIVYIFSTYAIQIGSMTLLAYGLSETYFSNSIPVLLPFTFVLSTLAMGIALPLRSGLINGSLSTSGSADRPLFSLGFTVALVIVLVLNAIFLFNVADRQEREALSLPEE